MKRVLMKTNDIKKARLNVDCTLEERRLIRMIAAKQDKNISQFLLGLVRRELQMEGLLSSDENFQAINEKHSNAVTQ